MKRTLFVAALAALTVCWAGMAYADHESNAVAHVFVEVDANIGVLALAPHLDIGSVQTGTFCGMIPFRIDANTQKVKLGAAASHLFKGDDPDSVHVDPILLDLDADEAGIDCIPHNGNPVGGHSHRLLFTQGETIEGFPGMRTESWIFESAQNNHFSQQVDLVVTWLQDDPEKPMGEYSGKVKMYAWIVLPGDE